MPSFDPRMTRRAAVLTDEANDLLDLIIEMTAFAAASGVYYPEDASEHRTTRPVPRVLRKSAEFVAAPELSPIQFAAEQAEAWVAEGMSVNGD